MHAEPSPVLEAGETPQSSDKGMDKTRVTLVLMGACLVVALIAILALSVAIMQRDFPFPKSKPHRSGSERDGVDIVDFLENSLRKSGFDEVKKVPYLLVHPQPDPEHPNSVRLIHDNGTVLLEAKMTEDRIPGIDTDIGPAYLAFSAQGTVEAELIFVNYGRYEDFDKLEKEGISVAGYICLARYGKGTRGDKVRQAFRHSTSGCTLRVRFSAGTSRVHALAAPRKSGVRQNATPLASLRRGAGADDEGSSATMSEAMRIMNPPGLPKIPAQVIGYDDARVLLKQLGGQDWAVEGGFNFTYKTGPFSPKHTGM
ncbi:unnamed protein product [Ixodes persulcatus]